MANSVVFKGSKNGIHIILNKDCEFNTLIDELGARLVQAKSFFGDSCADIIIEGRELSDEEYAKTEEIIRAKMGETVNVSQKDYSENLREIGKVEQSPDIFSLDEGLTKFYRKNVRSGQRIEAACNLVIVGDVNPGAEILAYGNIVVFGSLKGVVHAGCNGNRDAFVTAIGMYPSQLRIAEVYTRSPDTKEDETAIPEIAYISNDKIIIEPFLPKKIN